MESTYATHSPKETLQAAVVEFTFQAQADYRLAEEQITDSLGNLQYIPFPACSETGLPLAFAYDTPAKVICTIDYLEDSLYHLLEYFVHSDVPLTCRVPSYPLQNGVATTDASSSSTTIAEAGSSTVWTPLTIALQGTLQKSHLHLHTSINVLFHTTTITTTAETTINPPTHLIGATAYSLPKLTTATISSSSSSPPSEGIKVVRTEPLTLTFNTGWIEGDALPGMVGGRPMVGVTDHGVGFTVLSFCALAASAGLGAMAMMMWERGRSRRGGRGRSVSLNGALSPAGAGEMAVNANGAAYPGYGGYPRQSGSGKRD